MRLAHFLVISLALFVTSCSPLAKFTTSQEAKKAPSTIKFTNDSQKADRYEWDFGDGETSNLENPEHKYYLSGKYEVTLKAYKKKKVKEVKQEVIIDAPDKCLVLIETNYGDMLVELYDETPLHRDNFLKLAEEKFYNGLLFHRVVEGFMIQGGDPYSKSAKPPGRVGTGGPGYQLPAEISPKFSHVKGALAAARMPDAGNPEKKSSGSQFYIVHGNTISDAQLDKLEVTKGMKYTAEQREIMSTMGGYPFLDMDYTIFGQVLVGFEVIDKIATVSRDRVNRPEENIYMNITVIK